MIYEYAARKYWCEDISLIENYDKAMADVTQTRTCHHRLDFIRTGTKYYIGELNEHETNREEQ